MNWVDVYDLKKNISVYELKSLLEKNLKIADNIRILTEPD